MPFQIRVDFSRRPLLDDQHQTVGNNERRLLLFGKLHRLPPPLGFLSRTRNSHPASSRGKKHCVHSNPTGSQLDLKMPSRWLQRFLTSSQPYRTCVVPHALFRCSFSSITVETDSRRRAESSRTSPIRRRISILQVCGSFSNPAALGQAYPKDNFEKQCESHSSAQHQLSPVPAISETQCAWTRQGATIVRINSTKRPL